MAVSAQTIIDRVRSQLIDTDTSPRWTDAELLRWTSDAQRTIVSLIPAATSTTVTLSLSSGTRQTIPSDGHMLLSVIRNLNADSSSARAVRITTRELLDGYNSDWHASPSTKYVQNYTYDPQTPDVFYVYPPNNGLGKVEITYSIMPTELTTGTDNLTVADIYQTAVIDYVMYRAHQKDSDYAAGQAVAAGYLQIFLAHLGQGDAAELNNSPNMQLAPSNPNTKGSAR